MMQYDPITGSCPLPDESSGTQRAREAVSQDFSQCRQWGVRSFPTLLLERHGELSLLSTGYVDFETLLSRLNAQLPAVAERTTE